MEKECVTSKCLKVSLHHYTARLVATARGYNDFHTLGHEIPQICIPILPHCSIVRSYEEIVSMFAQQLEDGNQIPFMTENILVVTELVSLDICKHGRSLVMRFHCVVYSW